MKVLCFLYIKIKIEASPPLYLLFTYSLFFTTSGRGREGGASEMGWL
jgi:hypothetical protein